MKPFDPNKPCQYRNGEPARIVCTDLKGARPIISLRYSPGGTEKIFSHYESGQQFCDYENSFDLINIPVKHEYWANVYRFKSGTGVYIGDPDLYESQEEAVSGIQKNFDHVATVKIEWEE